MSKEPRDLQELKESLCEGDCQECDTPKQLLEIISTLTAKVKRYQEALEFYAKDAWIGYATVCCEVVTDDINRPYPNHKLIGGKRARAALNQGECKNE